MLNHTYSYPAAASNFQYINPDSYRDLQVVRESAVLYQNTAKD